MNEIESLSKIDITCEWTKLKEPSLASYKPIPIKEFCCVKNIETNLVPIDDENIRLARTYLLNVTLSFRHFKTT